MKSIEVVIAGRSFPLKVTEEEEALVLQVIEEINEKVHNLQNIYLQKDKQDCLSMALLTYALETAKLKNDLAGLNELREVSDQIENSILRITL
ncbi:MAG TPA: cell division protein ZapA [Saprospiraceae bacterium]|nr:cell division protein ZapA [Saprospiraceae bacterium]